MKILRQLYRLLTPAERRQALLLLPLLGLGALVEVAGIASILPFLALVVDPAAVDSRPVVRWLYEAGGFDDTRAFLLALGVLTFCLVVGSNVLTGFNTWAILRFSWLRNHTLGLRLLRSYLARPYPFFLERHSADLAKNLLAEVRQVVGGVLVRAVQMGARGVAALGILALLLVIDPLLAVLVPAILGGAYGLVYLAVRRRQRRMGESRFQANARRYQVLSEAFGGIKELKLLARERHVVERFRPPSLEHATTTAANFAMFQIPHFALEAIAFGGMLLIVLYLLARGHEATAILPTLGLYAFAGYRLMPSLKEVFNGLVDLRFNAAALENLLADLPRRDVTLPDAARIGPPLPLRESIRCRDLGFRYPTAARPLFRGLNLEIAAGGSVAFVGATGCGKSTLGDLLLGMLRPDAGVIEVDGVALDESNLARWRKNLGYVPQSIFLADESVTRNISFGLPDSEIDSRAVERAARAAHLHDFVRDELPDGYDTVVGERGVRLSGGQRQRIGIARALYHDPQVILFDEATSSLDRPTEEVVLEAVAELTRERTVIMIAHRLSTVRLCERIFLLADGEIVAVGGYEELLASHPGFRALVAGSGVAGNEVTGNEVAGVEAG